MAVISGGKVIEGARYRGGAEAGDLTGYGPQVYSGTASAGSPTSGTAGYGAGTLEPGAEVISVAGKTRFVNTNTKADPTWTQIGSA